MEAYLAKRPSLKEGTKKEKAQSRRKEGRTH